MNPPNLDSMTVNFLHEIDYLMEKDINSVYDIDFQFCFAEWINYYPIFLHFVGNSYE